MKIIKRNGSEATFDSEKIVAAITKANNSEEGTRLSPEQIHDIADYVEYKCNKIGRAVSVEEVQDMVENQIRIEVISLKRQALLPTDKGKALTEFQQEGLQLPKQGGFDS